VESEKIESEKLTKTLTDKRSRRQKKVVCICIVSYVLCYKMYFEGLYHMQSILDTWKSCMFEQHMVVSVLQLHSLSEL